MGYKDSEKSLRVPQQNLSLSLKSYYYCVLKILMTLAMILHSLIPLHDFQTCVYFGSILIVGFLLLSLELGRIQNSACFLATISPCYFPEMPVCFAPQSNSISFIENNFSALEVYLDKEIFNLLKKVYS